MPPNCFMMVSLLLYYQWFADISRGKFYPMIRSNKNWCIMRAIFIDCSCSIRSTEKIGKYSQIKYDNPASILCLYNSFDKI